MSFPAEIEQRMRRERGRDRGGKIFESENEFRRRSVAQKWRRGADFGGSVGLIRENLSRLRLSASV